MNTSEKPKAPEFHLAETFFEMFKEQFPGSALIMCVRNDEMTQSIIHGYGTQIFPMIQKLNDEVLAGPSGSRE